MILTALMLAQAAPMAMPTAAPAPCPAVPAPLPAMLAGWTAGRPVTASAGAKGAQTLMIGQGARATLIPVATLALPARPAKPPAAGSYGGVFAFRVASPGRYRVALGAGVWIDVVAGTTALVSVAHGHGPACSSVRKMVDFDLKPGDYQLQLVDSASPTLALMVARVS